MKFGDISSLHLNTTVKQMILRETKINVFKHRQLPKPYFFEHNLQ